MNHSISQAINELKSLSDEINILISQIQIDQSTDFRPVTLFSLLAEKFIQYIEDGDTTIIPRTLCLMEEFLTNGSQDLQDAVATGFLESLTNSEKENVNKFLSKHLGNESLQYCKEWDSFNGVKSRGLY